jgi:hypothetical protein
MHRNNISFIISIRSTHIKPSFFYCALVFRLGQNLSNIPRSILLKQKFPLILPLTFIRSTKLQILPLFFRLTSLLSTELHKSSRILCTKATDLCTELSLFFSSQQSQFQVPATEPFVGTGADPGFNASTTHNKTLTTTLSATPAKQMKSHPR